MIRTLQGKLKRTGHVCNNKKPKKINRSIQDKRLSIREIEELMGVRRDIYERRNGAIRRK